jgi:hypothetical protein
MICNRCVFGIYGQAFSKGTCKECGKEIISSHFPCNVYCEKCAKILNKCEQCGKELKEEGD